MQATTPPPLRIILVICLLLMPMSTIMLDFASPSLPAMAIALSTTPSNIRFSVSLCLFGYAIGEILIGSLSDQWGRRNLLISTLAVLGLTNLWILYYPHTELLYAVRLMQGITSAAPSVLARAILTDTYTSTAQTKHLGKLPAAYALSAILSVVTSAYLQDHYGWQATIVVPSVIVMLAALFCVWQLPETCLARRPIRLSALKLRYRHLLCSPRFIRCTLICIISIVQLPLFATLGTFLIQSSLGYTAGTFGRYCAVMNAAFLIGATYYVSSLYRFPFTKIYHACLNLIGLCALMFLWISYTHTMTLATLLIPVTAIHFLSGIMVSCTYADVMNCYPRALGTTSAVFGCTAMLACSIILFVSASLKVHHQLEYAWLEVGAVAIIMLLYHLTQFITQPTQAILRRARAQHIAP